MSRIALVCDWLTTPGGAEKVLLELHRMYPDAPIYTSQYREQGIDWFKDATIHTGWLNFFPAGLRKILGPLRQIYFSHLDLSSYDLVISVTGAEAKSVKTHRARTCTECTSSKAYHLCYCHVPTQYYWHLYDQYLENPGFGLLNPIVRFFLKLFVRPLRRADFRAAERPDQFVTISRYAAAQIKQYYHREAKIIHPPVDLQKFSTDFSTTSKEFFTELSTQPHSLSTKTRDFSTTFPQSTLSRDEISQSFVISCRQATWKRIDLAITACLTTHQSLLVIGDGPEHDRLVALAAGSPLIHFLPWLSSDELARYLQAAKAYLFPSLEPFGIAAVEALAAGCPVIAYADGGSRDFIRPGENGLLFSEQTTDSLVRAIRKFSHHTFDRAAVRASAQAFSLEAFRSKVSHLVDHCLTSSANSPSSRQTSPQTRESS